VSERKETTLLAGEKIADKYKTDIERIEHKRDCDKSGYRISFIDAIAKSIVVCKECGRGVIHNKFTS